MSNPDDGRCDGLFPCSYDEAYRLSDMFLPETTNHAELVRSYLEALVGWRRFIPKDFTSITITEDVDDKALSEDVFRVWGQPISVSLFGESVLHTDRRRQSWIFFNAFSSRAMDHVMTQLMRPPSVTKEGRPLTFTGYKFGFQGPLEFTNGPLVANMIVRAGQMVTFNNGTKIIPYWDWVAGLEKTVAMVIIGTPKVEIAARVDCGEKKSTLRFSAKVTGDYEVHHYVA